MSAISIVNEALTRVTAITVAGGFNTNIGNSASIAEKQYNPDEITTDGAVNVYDTEDANEDDEIVGSELVIRMGITVEGHIRVDTGNAVTLAHKLVSDIKKAMLLANDRVMDGLVLDVRYSGREVSYPSSAGDVVSARVNFYVLYMETYGNP